MERLTITLETGNDSVQERIDTYPALIASNIWSGRNSGIIRDINGNKIGKWKWEPLEETKTQEVLNETFNRT